MDEPAADSAETCRLLERARAGDRQAFEDLFARYRPDLCRFLAWRLDPQLRGRLDVSDVVQEAQLDAFRRLQDFLARRPMPLRSWLLKTAYERLLKLRRRHRGAARRTVDREVALPEQSSLLLAGQLLARGPTPSQRLAREELAVRVREAVARLPEADREVLLMRTFDGLAFEEIAQILGISAAASRQRHGRALLRLLALLAEDGLTESQL